MLFLSPFSPSCSTIVQRRSENGEFPSVFTIISILRIRLGIDEEESRQAFLQALRFSVRKSERAVQLTGRERRIPIRFYLLLQIADQTWGYYPRGLSICFMRSEKLPELFIIHSSVFLKKGTVQTVPNFIFPQNHGSGFVMKFLIMM